MAENTFKELVEAIDFNVQALAPVSEHYTAGGLQNLRNIIYCLDRIQHLTSELVAKVEQEISNLSE
jgi:hypothetical protein